MSVMNVESILAVTGKSELFKMVARGRNGLIAETLDGSKKMPIGAHQGVSALSEIAIYTYEKEVPLKEILGAIYAKFSGEKALSPKDSADTLKKTFAEVLPDYDAERVYVSDIKKVFGWYNQLIAAGYGLEATQEEEKSETVTEDSATDETKAS